MKIKKLIIFYTAFCYVPYLICVTSIVYNFRIAETTKRHRTEITGPYSVASLLAFNLYRHQYTGQREDYAGGMATYIHVSDPFYIRIDWAAAQVQAKNIDLHLSKAETDDLLIYSGYSFEPNERTKGTLSVLFGIPTHKDRSIVNPQFGYGEVGLGAQLSGAFNFSELNPGYSIRMAGRFIHFFPRRQTVSGTRFKFSAGNLADLIVLMRISTQPEKHRVSFGYNPTFFFGATISPSLDDVAKDFAYSAHSFYFDYKYRFLINNYHAAISWGISYGFELRFNEFNVKRIILAWWTAGINF